MEEEMMNENKTPLVSVVLCTFNDETTISSAIESILRQSFTDFEFIIWNDGSTDNTEKIVKSFNDKRIKYYYNSNTGLGKALNLACQKACGKYIARMDGDDFSLIERLGKEVDYMESHPHCVLLSSAVFYMDAGGNIRSFPYTWNIVLQNVLKRNNPFVHPASMFRREVFLKTAGYPGTRCFQDRIMFKRLSRLGTIHNLSAPLLLYRFSSTSVSHSLGKYIPLLKELERLIAESEKNNEELESLFNEVYYLAKKDNCAQEQKYGVENINKCYRLMKIVIPSILAENIIIFFHNLIGFIKYCR